MLLLQTVLHLRTCQTSKTRHCSLHPGTVLHSSPPNLSESLWCSAPMSPSKPLNKRLCLLCRRNEILLQTPALRPGIFYLHSLFTYPAASHSVLPKINLSKISFVRLFPFLLGVSVLLFVFCNKTIACSQGSRVGRNKTTQRRGKKTCVVIHIFMD